jgi:hypothetical protein
MTWPDRFRPPFDGRLAELLDSARLLALPVTPAVVVRAGDEAGLLVRARRAALELEVKTGRRLGDDANPLLLTVQDPAPGAALDRRRHIPDLASPEQLDEAVLAAAAWSEPSELLVRTTVGDASSPALAAGLACTREPTTGMHGLHGECRLLADGGRSISLAVMRNLYPAAHRELERALSLLEARHRVMCVLEFALAGQQLRITSGAFGVPEVPAAIRILVDLFDEGLVSPEEALEHLPLSAMEAAEQPVLSRDGVLVAAQPDSYAARVLAWCSDQSSAEVVDEVPAGFVAIGDPGGAARLPLAPGYLVDLPPTATREAWAALVGALVERGAEALAVVYDAALGHLAPVIAAGPWTHVVAPPGRVWAAQVLAARLRPRAAGLAL